MNNMLGSLNQNRQHGVLHFFFNSYLSLSFLKDVMNILTATYFLWLQTLHLEKFSQKISGPNIILNVPSKAGVKLTLLCDEHLNLEINKTVQGKEKNVDSGNGNSAPEERKLGMNTIGPSQHNFCLLYPVIS